MATEPTSDRPQPPVEPFPLGPALSRPSRSEERAPAASGGEILPPFSPRSGRSVPASAGAGTDATPEVAESGDSTTTPATADGGAGEPDVSRSTDLSWLDAIDWGDIASEADATGTASGEPITDEAPTSLDAEPLDSDSGEVPAMEGVGDSAAPKTELPGWMSWVADDAPEDSDAAFTAGAVGAGAGSAGVDPFLQAETADPFDTAEEDAPVTEIEELLAEPVSAPDADEPVAIESLAVDEMAREPGALEAAAADDEEEEPVASELQEFGAGAEQGMEAPLDVSFGEPALEAAIAEDDQAAPAGSAADAEEAVAATGAPPEFEIDRELVDEEVWAPSDEGPEPVLDGEDLAPVATADLSTEPLADAEPEALDTSPQAPGVDGVPLAAFGDVADRLERLAQKLRTRSPAELLAGSDDADPLELLLTGFALGYAAQPRHPDSEAD